MPERDDMKLTDEIAETMREVYETAEGELLMIVNKSLVEDVKDPMAFKREKTAMRSEVRKLLESKAESTAQTVEIATRNAAKLAGISPKAIQFENVKMGRILIQSAINFYAKSVIAIYRLAKVRPLAEAIFKQTQQGIENGLPVITKSGKTWGYKEYMEMNVRTTIQHDIGETLLKAGEQSGVVFYVCDSYGDCANDHRDYQGKYYYDEGWESFNLTDEAKDQIREYIRRNRLKSVQEVRDNEPWLTTRPNCRHRFHPVSIEQVLHGSLPQTLKSNKWERGTYRQENYDATQQQRSNEREIRFYKDRKAQNEQIMSGLDKGSELAKLYRAQIRKDNVLVKKWQAEQRTLIENNPNLDRDYRRETRKVLLNDLGAKFQR